MEQNYDILSGADRLDEVVFSKIRVMMDQVAALRASGTKVIALSAGEPNFNTPEPIKQATIRAIEDNYTHYGSNRGLPRLRGILSDMIEEETGVRYDPETEMIMTTGGAEALNNVFTALVNPGDEVIILSPAFISYENLVHMCGGAVVTLPLKKENGFQIDLDDLKKVITPKTKMLVMNNPNNPTGAVYAKETLAAVCALAKKENFLIFSDEMYSRLLYAGAEFQSVAAFPGMKERSVIVNGFSKTYAMTGWRVGYITGPKRVMTSILKVHQYCSTCSTTFLHVGMADAIQLPETQAAVQSMVEEFAKRRELLIAGLDAIPKLSYVAPMGAFYAMVDVSETGMDGDSFADRLLAKKHVAVIPGSGLGESVKDCVRISFAASDEDIIEGLKRIEELVSE